MCHERMLHFTSHFSFLKLITNIVIPLIKIKNNYKIRDHLKIKRKEKKIDENKLVNFAFFLYTFTTFYIEIRKIVNLFLYFYCIHFYF